MDADKDLFVLLPALFGFWLKVMRAGTCPYSGTCLLQEDSCLSSGLKCMMKGTAYVMGAAA